MAEKDGCHVNSSHFHVQGGGLDGQESQCFPIDYMLQKAIAAEQAKAFEVSVICGSLIGYIKAKGPKLLLRIKTTLHYH